MGYKAAETTWNIKHLAQELLMNIRCSGDSRSFAKENRALKMRSIVAGHRKLTATNWEDQGRWSLLQLQNLLKNSTSIILCSFGIGNKLKGEILISRCPMNWPKKKKSWFWSTIFFYYAQQQWTISWVDCDVQWKVDFMWQSSMTSSTVGLRRSSKTLPQAKLAPKNGHSHCLVACCPSGLL